MTGTKPLKTISQETFDNVVQENINDFEMDHQQALEDAIEQFKSQGVNISNIIKEVPTNGKHKVALLANSLSDMLMQEECWDKESAADTVRSLKVELCSDLSKRYFASKTTDISENLFRLCVKATQNTRFETDSFKAYCALVNGQPDEATWQHMEFFICRLKDTDDAEQAEVLCKILKHLCTMQENNRQTLVKMGIISTLMEAMEKYIRHVGVIRECCGTFRALTLDDDVRVEFGQSHEHAKMIVTERSGLQRFVNVLKEYYSDPMLAKEIAATLSKVMVRNEFCQDFVDMGGFSALREAVSTHMAIVGVVKQCVDLLRAISRNDDVKIYVMKDGVVGMLMEVLEKYIANPSICESCFAALTTLTLRNPAHCKVVASAAVAPVVVQAMKVHKDHAGVQKATCMLIRNLVARTREYSSTFLELGAEELIRSARRKHSSVPDVDDLAKAALRDLDLDVDLQQLWTGTNRQVTN